MVDLAAGLRPALDDFTGVVSVSHGTSVEFEAAYGMAHRALASPNTVETQFGLASGTKAFTAVVIAALVAEGRLTMTTTARSVLGDDLPLVDNAVTVGHLLEHTSGIGDYFDEDVESDFDDYVLQVPVHTLVDQESYLPALDGFPTKFPAGERFSYCNAGYVVLALIAERVTGRPYPELAADHVFGPAGMEATAFLRSDRLPARAALGYVKDGRSNVHHLPVLGSGDGGVYSTAGDLRRFWLALFGGRLLVEDATTELLTARHDVPVEDLRYARGLWLHRSGPEVMMLGEDAGVSFRSVHNPTTGRTHTVLSNTTNGAWPLTHHLAQLVG